MSAYFTADIILSIEDAEMKRQTMFGPYRKFTRNVQYDS